VKAIIIGGGPAGLYCGLLLKKADPTREISILERNPPDATYGWGVVFSERTLSGFQEADYQTYKQITDRFVLWDAIDVHYRGEIVRCGGQAFAGVARKALLNILQRRCDELGVALRFGVDVSDPAAFADADIIIAADGVNSTVRQSHARAFKPQLEPGEARYIWYGTNKTLDAVTFIIRANEHGLFQVHAYPFDGFTSTFIVECGDATWRRAGLDQADEAASIAYCEDLFSGELGGASLLSNNSRWINFITVRNARWSHRNVVLLGDAAHTAHFSIGSGTKLAMEDAIALAEAFQRHRDIKRAVHHYELGRRPAVEALQHAAAESRTYFESLKRYIHLEPVQFAFHLLTRSGRISYSALRLRDSSFVDTVDRWFAHANGAAGPASRVLVAPPPMLTGLPLRGLMLRNRIALACVSTAASSNGLPTDVHHHQLALRAESGPGLVLTEPAAVSQDARITPGCAGMYEDAHQTAWAGIVASIHANSTALVGVVLGHAGRRGATRPRWEGLDRPLRNGAWPLLSASPLPYTPQSQVPREMDRANMQGVRSAHVRAAEMAREAGFDVLVLHAAHGYLLASFISPLTNLRTDAYGGSLQNRMRFPLEVLDAVRAVWPQDRPICVMLSATDWALHGIDLEESAAAASMMKDHGADLVYVLAGQTTLDARPTYGRAFLSALSDRVRNEARVATMTGGHLTTTDEVNSILAAGRADLCVMELPELDDGSSAAVR